MTGMDAAGPSSRVSAPSTDQRQPGDHHCCSGAMRELVVNDGAIRLFICDRCHQRTWAIDGHDVGADLALSIARWLDSAD